MPIFIYAYFSNNTLSQSRNSQTLTEVQFLLLLLLFILKYLFVFSKQMYISYYKYNVFLFISAKNFLKDQNEINFSSFCLL